MEVEDVDINQPSWLSEVEAPEGIRNAGCPTNARETAREL